MKLLEKFPQLATSGYELLMYHRGGDESAFCPLKSPYVPKRLKEVAGQCKIYIKPLQKYLIEGKPSSLEVSTEVLKST